MSYNPTAQGTKFQGSSRSIATGYQNGSVASFGVATPVSVNSAGQITALNVTSEASVDSFVGLTQFAIPSAASGQVVSQGRLENAQTIFSVGTPLWINYDGTLTNIQPDASIAGWATGSWCIYIGIVVQNEFNSSLQDILVHWEIIGQI